MSWSNGQISDFQGYRSVEFLVVFVFRQQLHPTVSLNVNRSTLRKDDSTKWVDQCPAQGRYYARTGNKLLQDRWVKGKQTSNIPFAVGVYGSPVVDGLEFIFTVLDINIYKSHRQNLSSAQYIPHKLWNSPNKWTVHTWGNKMNWTQRMPSIRSRIVCRLVCYIKI